MNKEKRKHEKIYSKNVIILVTPAQHEFLRLFAYRKGASISKILRFCIGRLMIKNPDLAEMAEAHAKE